MWNGAEQIHVRGKAECSAGIRVVFPRAFFDQMQKYISICKDRSKEDYPMWRGWLWF